MASQPQRTKCRSCSAAIVWALTEQGKRIPLVADRGVVVGLRQVQRDLVALRDCCALPVESARDALIDNRYAVVWFVDRARQAEVRLWGTANA